MQSYALKTVYTHLSYRSIYIESPERKKKKKKYTHLPYFKIPCNREHTPVFPYFRYIDKRNIIHVLRAWKLIRNPTDIKVLKKSQ